MTTQQQIAEHLGLSQQAVSKQLSKLGIDWKTASLDQIRLEYIKQKLARERIETERVLIQLKKEKGELVDIKELIPVLRTVFSGFKNRLLAIPNFVRSEVYVATGREMDELVFTEKCEETLKDCYEYVNGYSQTIESSGGGGGSPG